MLNTLKIKLQGRHHSGIDDCRNISSIVTQLIRRGINIQATGSLSPKGRFIDTTREAGYVRSLIN